MNDYQKISIVEVKLANDKSVFQLFASDNYIGQVENQEFARLFANSYNMYRFMKLLRDNADYDEKSSNVFKMVAKILDDVEGKSQEEK